MAPSELELSELGFVFAKTFIIEDKEIKLNFNLLQIAEPPREPLGLLVLGHVDQS